MESSDSEAFTDLETGAFDDSRVRWRWFARPLGLLVTYGGLFAGAVYAYRTEGGEAVIVAGHEIATLDWVSLFALLAIVLVVVPAVLKRPGRTLAFVRTFTRDRVAAIGALGTVVLVLLAVGGPLVYPRPEVDPVVSYQPPVGTTVDDFIPVNCVGSTGDSVCRGTWEYPLGTDNGGKNLVHIVVYGLRTSLQIGVSAAVIAGGIGTAVGLVAGTFGGRIDRVLMRYVDIQSAIPAFFVYVLVVAILSADFVLMAMVFGLLSWGGLARLVRSEVHRINSTLYVRAATASGATTYYNLRYHVLPNIAGAVIVPLSALVPTFILYAAALSFLGFGESDPRIVSLGNTIADGLSHSFANWWDVWWYPVVPAVALTALVLSMLLVGDRLSQLADPRER
ncbi:ABC transporter permease [Halobacteria archaeon AArc-curdl1]|uniref:ABC transporter permease n=1 Tax=Natronosalvus hydrolyticus TaxID=2979988 RepID=A0AAP2Z5B7_9EURY|nr:ABC transporter permease [Halobacteria archaeon AArc-curdl1]